MKRLLAATSLSLATVLAVTSLADGQLVTARVLPDSVSSSVNPKRDRTRPYKFTTTGRVRPGPYCATVGATDCIPFVCPPGATDRLYCVRPPVSLLCTGSVTIKVKKIFTTVSSRTVAVRSDCTYRSLVSFRTRSPLTRGTLRVQARFEGNSFLLPRSATTKTVRAG